MANVTMQLLLELRQFRQAWDQASAAAQAGAQKISRSAQQGGRAMDAAKKKATGFAGAMDFLKKRVIGAGLFFAAFYQGLITLRQFIGSAVAELFNLDDALRRVQSITKESDASIERLKGRLIGLAKQGKLLDQSAADVADSMFVIAQAGYSSADALTIARLAAEGAAVGFTKAETAAGVLTSVLKAYDLPVSDARHVMDVLFQTVNTGIITFEGLAGGLGKVLSSASALDVPLEEVGAAVATMTLRGFTGAQAMTSLGRMMQTFIRPSQRAKDVAAELGIELNAATVQSKGFTVMLQEMFVAAGGDVTKFSAMFDQIQATRGAVSLFSDDGKLLTAVLEEMGLASEGAGAMADALEERAKSLKFQLGVLRSQALAVVVDALEPLMEGLAGVLKHMNNVLAGRNAIFNYFADMHSLVVALVLAFLYMKREAIAEIFASIAKALTGLVGTMGRTVAQTSVLRATMMGLGSILSALGPVLVFLAAFALVKFAGQLDALHGVSAVVREDMGKLSVSLQEIDDMARDFGLEQAVVDGMKVDAVVKGMTDSFDAWADSLDNTQAVLRGGFKDAGAWANALSGAVGWVTSGFQDMGTTAETVLGDVQKEIRAMVEDQSLTIGQVNLLKEQYRDLAFAAKDAMDREIYWAAFLELQKISAEAWEHKQAILEARKAQGLLKGAIGDTTTTIKEVQTAIEKWAAPINDAKRLMEEILGLTSKQDLLLRAAVDPILARIALRDAYIVALTQQAVDATGILPSKWGEVDEGVNPVLDKYREQIGALKDVNEQDDLIIKGLEAQHGALEANNQSLSSQKLAYWLVSQAIDERLYPSIQDALLLAGQGPEALQGWVEGATGIERAMREEAILALADFLAMTEEEPDLGIDVDEALRRLGLVQDRIGAIGRLLAGGMGLAAGALGFMPELAGRQRGVRNFVGGLVRVGEAGEELVRLPRGSDVIPRAGIGPALRQQAAQAPSLAASAEVNITTSLLKDFVELKNAVLRAVSEQLDTAAARAGMAKPRFGTFGAGIPRI